MYMMGQFWNWDTFIDWGNHHIILSLKRTLVRKSKTLPLNKHKIVGIGDSHIKGCSEILSDQLDNAYKVIGFCKPNTDLESIISTINTEIKHFTKNDVVVVCGGTKKISRNDSISGLRSLPHFALNSSNSNVIAICAAQQLNLLSSLHQQSSNCF